MGLRIHELRVLLDNLDEGRQFVRTVSGGGAAQIERSCRQAGAHAAAGLARLMLRPVELAAAATAATARTRRRPVAGCRRWCGGGGGGSDATTVRRMVVLRRAMRRRQQQRRRHGRHVTLLRVMQKMLMRLMKTATQTSS